MNSDRFSFKLFLYLLILSGLGFAFFWSLSSSQLIITKAVIALLFVAFFIFLLRYINKTNRDLSKFLEAIKYLDNVSTGNSSDLSFKKLNVTYNKIIDQLKEAWLAKEREHQYFQFTLENIAVGVISFDERGYVEILNKAAKSILGINKLGNIEELGLIGDELKHLKSEESKLIRLDATIDQLNVLVKSTDIKIGNISLKLITLQDIKTQLEQSELEAWQKLIKVLTHEIMNSVTPVKSLTYSMQKILKSNDTEETKNQNLLKGLNAIEKRSKGLLEFVESYKNLTQIRKPTYERVFIKNLVESIHNLFKEEFKNQNVQFVAEVLPEDISVIADEKLITQVIINLVQNSLKALLEQSNRMIRIKSGMSENDKVFLSVFDNGDGIDDSIMENIFVPFFSTREEGSGIGLSFARQVMVLHNGRIDVHSQKGEGTEFILTF